MNKSIYFRGLTILKNDIDPFGTIPGSIGLSEFHQLLMELRPDYSPRIPVYIFCFIISPYFVIVKLCKPMRALPFPEASI